MTTGELTGLIVALTGLIGLFLAHRLGILGQKKDAQQQTAATKLQERIASFDELESLNSHLREEINRLRDLLNEAETRGDVRLAAQARRCSARLEETFTALATLQSVVLSEIARADAHDAIAEGRRHVDEDHPDLD